MEYDYDGIDLKQEYERLDSLIKPYNVVNQSSTSPALVPASTIQSFNNNLQLITNKTFIDIDPVLKKLDYVCHITT
ncbi:unnamed protein product [Cunninghamella blakesleeana]